MPISATMSQRATGAISATSIWNEPNNLLDWDWRDFQFGVQARIDLGKPDRLELLGVAGCVSIEAGVESLTVEGRGALAKRCRLDTDELADLLIKARRHVPFVKANLIGMEEDEAEMVAAWRDRLLAAGVWANEPVPLYPYLSPEQYEKQHAQPPVKDAA